MGEQMKLTCYDDVFAALMGRMDACRDAGVDTMSPEATVWYENDPETIRIKHLHTVYQNALDYAGAHTNYVGVGRITFAEAALIEAQV